MLPSEFWQKWLGIGLLCFGAIIFCWTLVDVPLSRFFYELSSEPSGQTFLFTSLILPILSIAKWITTLGWGGTYYILCFLGLGYAKWAPQLRLQRQTASQPVEKSQSQSQSQQQQTATQMRRRKIGQLSRQILTTLLASGGLVLLLKTSLGRARPYRFFANQSELASVSAPNTENPMLTFFTIQSDYLSFPSGHTQVIFAVTTMLSLHLPSFRRNLLLTLLLFAACLVAFTRVTLLAHFLSDIILGGFIGALTANIVFRLHQK